MRRAHVYSPAAQDVSRVLGLEIARARRTRRIGQEDLAERAGISTNTLRHVEQGLPTVAAGIVFEVAALVGLDLLGTGPGGLPAQVSRSEDRLSLLPSRVRPRHDDAVDDDF